MKLIHYAGTDIGQVRKKNEDAFLVDPELELFAVADGMGGHQAGEVASHLALESLQAALGNADVDAEQFAAAIRAANRRVFEESVARGHVQGMGTTLTALWLAGDDGGWIGHVGDSRCYRLRDGQLDQLTRDHSWIQAQIDEGLITKEEAQLHPLRNVITRSIGFEPEIDGDLVPLELQAGDTFLIASDGLTGKLSDADLLRHLEPLASSGDGEAVVGALIAAANARGGEDNITVVLVRAAD